MWCNPTLFHLAKSTEQYIEKRSILSQSIEKSFLIDPLPASNALYRDSFTLRKKDHITHVIISL